MKDINEEVVIQILRVEEPITLHDLRRWMPEARIDDLDQTLWELNRQGRVHVAIEGGKEEWFYGHKV